MKARENGRIHDIEKEGWMSEQRTERQQAGDSIADWLAKRAEQAHKDADAHPEGNSNRAFYRGQAIAYENALCAAIATAVEIKADKRNLSDL